MIFTMQKDLIYELDSDGNMIPSSSNDINKQPTNNNPLHLPEVQSHLQSNSDQWATPDLFETITQNHPKLAQRMVDPQYMAALQAMQTNPKETLERLKQSSPEIVEFLMEFCGVMGEHFTKLGSEDGGDDGGETKASRNMASDKKIREMGPLEKKALDRHKETQKEKETKQNQQQQNQQRANSTMNETDSQVSSILANDELRSILLDPKMQQIMEECSTGSKLRYYMSHEEYGPKLRQLMEAGLIQVA